MAFRAVKKRKRLDGEAEEDIGKVSLQIPIGIAGGCGGSTKPLDPHDFIYTAFQF